MRLNNFGIRARVLLLSLVPLVILSLILGPYTVITRFQDLDNALQERGDALLRHLVSASEAGILARDLLVLHDIAMAVAGNADVEEVIITDTDRNVLAHTAPNGASTDKELLMSFTAPVRQIIISRAEPDTDYSEPSIALTGARDNLIGWIELRMSRESTLSRRYAVIWNIVLLTSCAALISALIALAMGRGIVHPIIRLRNAVDNIRKGRLDTRVPSSTGGELRALEQGFNDMAEAMESSRTQMQNEIKVATNRLYHTIEALEHRNKELDSARQKALTASSEKANFLANMSHEIRTPISAILGYSALLGKSGITSDQHEYARTISRASTQLLRVIDDILSVAKLESGTVELDRSEFDLRDSFEDILCMMAPEARDKRLELVLIIDSDVPVKLVGDPVRIGQVFINLLSNAIKFTEQGGVTVHVLRAGSNDRRANIEVRVSDTGIGIDKDAQERIFTSFHQADASISRRYGGAGLGLAIVSRLVELWGGEVGVSSEPGKGSTFWFRFNCELQSSSTERVSDPQLIGRKVLLYDDNPAALRAVRNLLLTWTARIYVARRRELMDDMLRKAQESGDPFELAIMGISLGHQHGNEYEPNQLVDMIRQRYNLPLLLMVNCKQTSLLSRSLSDEGIKIVVKPVRRDILFRNLRSLFGLPILESASEPSPNAAIDEDFSGLRVLLAEDNEFNRMLVTKILESAGISVVQSTNGDHALEIAQTQDFDMVIMDLHLPGMDGAETACRLRELRPNMSRIPIIALTADVFLHNSEKLAAAGIDVCLLKPLDEKKLWQAVRALRPEWNTIAGKYLDTAPDAGASTAAIRELLQPKLIASIQQHRCQIAEAVADQDLSRLNDLIHELKGVVGYFGLQDLSRTVNDLERAIDTHSDAQEIALQLERLDAFIDQLTGRAGRGAGLAVSCDQG